MVLAGVAALEAVDLDRSQGLVYSNPRGKLVVIRTEQLRVLDALADSRLAERLMERARVEWPETAFQFELELLRECIRDGIARARALGVESNYDISCFVDLMFAFSPDFDTSPLTPWASEILNQPNTPAWVKRERLLVRGRRELAGR